MLLGLGRQQVWQAKVGGGVGHDGPSELEGDGGRIAATEAVRELVDADRQCLAGAERRTPVGGLLGGGVEDGRRGAGQRCR